MREADGHRKRLHPRASSPKRRTNTSTRPTESRACAASARLLTDRDIAVMPMAHCKPSTQITRMFIEDAVRTVLRECVEPETQDRPSTTVRCGLAQLVVGWPCDGSDLHPDARSCSRQSVRLHARLVA